MYEDMISSLALRGVDVIPSASMYSKSGLNKVAALAALAKNLSTDCAEIEDLKLEMNAKRYPRYLVIFDDISNETRSSSIADLLRWSRHAGVSVIICSHDPTNLLPAAFQEMNLICLFPGLKLDNIKRVVTTSAVPLAVNDVWERYKKLEKYHFLTLDKEKGRMYNDLRGDEESSEKGQ